MQKALYILILFSFLIPAKAQFYNGLQMDFGKNRVQYKKFVWQSFRFPKFDTYFYVGGKELAQYTANVAENKIKEFENYFGYTLEKRVIFLIYNNLSDFRQSNIGLVSGNDNYNIGGVTKIVDNKVFIYFDGNHAEFEKQINAAIAEVLISEMMFGSDFTSKVANNTLLTIPDWFFKGLISYLSVEWNSEIENRVKDGILSGKYEKFNRLSGEDAVYAGHSIWYFIAEKYGKKVIPNIIYLARVSKSSDSGFLYVLGMPLKYLSFEWLNFFDQRFYTDESSREFPDKKMDGIKMKRYRVYQQLMESPDGKFKVFSTNYSGQYRIFMHNTETKKTERIFKKGHKIDQITDYSYPLLAWHPSGKLFTFITEEKGSTWLWFYDLELNQLDKKELFNVEKIIDYSFNNRGNAFVLTALKDGQTDIFIYNNAANTYEAITTDLADDQFPRFSSDDNYIIFSSNRTNDTLGIDSVVPGLKTPFNIFVYNYKSRSKNLTRITSEKFANSDLPVYLSKNKYLLRSDINGIYNNYLAEYDSAISHIDTTVHYRYITQLKPLTNYSRNVEFYSYNKQTQTVSEILFKKGKYFFSESKIDAKSSKNTSNTPYRKKFLKEIERLDSLQLAKIKSDTLTQIVHHVNQDSLLFDTTKIDFRNYVFEFQKNKLRGFLPNDSSNIAKNKIINKKEIFAKPRLYMTSFYTNYFVSQVDFGFLNSTYQPFTGSAVYFNPGINVFFKIGSHDLFEDYKITGGIRFAGNFDSNEYLLSIENLKSRTDNQWVFHRLAMTNVAGNAILKTHTHELLYLRKYPVSQVMSFRGTVIGRIDKGTYLSTDLTTLKKESEYKYWSGLKGEWIFDNTKLVQLNIFNGARFKVFGEFYKQVDLKKSDIFIVGGDFRHYFKIHRNLILASRMAASTSFGSQKLVYYLGSVDNWINLSPKISTFDQSVAIDYSQNYVYQTLATNMRGFSQNIRNGNTFAVFNEEIRWPFIKYFVNRPMNSDFLENLQLIGFFDVGSAWVGSSPYDKKNAYNNEYVYQGPITVIIDKDRNPFVYGYGFGLRTRMLGYFIRADWAWGVENNVILPRIFYLSLSLDF